MLGAIALGAVALPAQASAQPVSPYNVFTVNGYYSTAIDSSAGGGVWLSTYPLFPGAERVEVGASSNTPGASAVITSLPGQKIAPGTYPTTRTGGTAGTYGLDLSAMGYECSGDSGTITIRSVTRDSDDNITSLAVWYHTSGCSLHGLGTWGEIRWNSKVGYVDAAQNTTNMLGDAMGVGLGQQGPAQTVTFTGFGSDPIQFGAVSFEGTAAGSFGVGVNTCTGRTLTYRQTCSVSVYAKPTALGDLSAVFKIADSSSMGFHAVSLFQVGRNTAAGTFFPNEPTRILDTRLGVGARKGALGAQQTLSLQIPRLGRVAEAGVSAVMLNVTVTNPTSASYLTVYPSGTTRPTASNLNFTAGWTGANSVTVPVGANGKIDIYNAGGSVDVIADVLGVYQGVDTMAYGTGGQYQPHNTTRVVDTRDSAWGGPLPGKWSLSSVIDYGAAINPHVRAVAVNITAVTPTMGGYLTAWAGGLLPLASTLNFTPNAIVPNFAVVPIRYCERAPSCAGMPEITIYNGSSGATHVLVDVLGFFDDAQMGPGFRFHPLTPTRIADTRIDLGGAGSLGPSSAATFTAPAPAAVDETGVLVANVTGVNNGNAWTYLTAWANGDARPTASNLNLAPHEVRPNAAFVLLGPSNKYNVYNAGSSVDVIVDVAGRFDYFPYPLPTGVTASNASAANKPPTARPSYQYSRS
ncbi:hypothetical protein GCM10010399_71600 [Dactylosporangium fulvum]|uniref:Uncharacterized protein n=1 Tax=Dactylosporangium fulvum TaxID=53359 RepID=A0ABY5W0C2_9ACTN|nr:hypothetical protein [Dactylosporangium fulvum]UWP82168.1 hypothetical protein Dfulv_45080 [Dactylosporangium fulvum]